MGGRDISQNELDFVEVVNNSTNCKVDNIPTRLYSAAGISGMICGGLKGYDTLYGHNSLSSCWHLNPNGTWTSGEEMIVPKKMFSLNKVEDEIIAIGGKTTSNLGLRSIERLILTNDEGWSRMKEAPINIGEHCALLVNTSYLMVIGGKQNTQVNSTQQQNIWS